jgi:hypothetical protein
MAADAGAQQILDLLSQDSPSLRQDLIAVAKASKNAHKKPYGVMPQYGIAALADVRTFFRDLRSQIDAIETVDTASKTSALQALDTIDLAIGSYERSLELGISKPALPKAKKAEKRAKQARKALHQATTGLSQ